MLHRAVFATPGTYSWQAPNGINTVHGFVHGAGGSATDNTPHVDVNLTPGGSYYVTGNLPAWGAAGGFTEGYVKVDPLSVTPLIVGHSGGSSSFGSALTATGGGPTATDIGEITAESAGIIIGFRARYTLGAGGSGMGGLLNLGGRGGGFAPGQSIDLSTVATPYPGSPGRFGVESEFRVRGVSAGANFGAGARQPFNMFVGYDPPNQGPTGATNPGGYGFVILEWTDENYLPRREITLVPGANLWRAPAGITRVHALVVGGGAPLGTTILLTGAVVDGWYDVTPGDTYLVIVGNVGQSSSFGVFATAASATVAPNNRYTATPGVSAGGLISIVNSSNQVGADSPFYMPNAPGSPGSPGMVLLEY